MNVPYLFKSPQRITNFEGRSKVFKTLNFLGTIVLFQKIPYSSYERFWFERPIPLEIPVLTFKIPFPLKFKITLPGVGRDILQNHTLATSNVTCSSQQHVTAVVNDPVFRAVASTRQTEALCKLRVK